MGVNVKILAYKESVLCHRINFIIFYERLTSLKCNGIFTSLTTADQKIY